MKRTVLQRRPVLARVVVAACSAAVAAGCGGGAPAWLAGEWEAAFTVDEAYPPRPREVGRTVHGRMNIDTGRPPPSRSLVEHRPATLQGGVRLLGAGSGELRVSAVGRGRGDSVRVVLRGGGGELVLVGVPRCGRMTGRWSRASRGDAASGRFELRRACAGGGAG